MAQAFPQILEMIEIYWDQFVTAFILAKHEKVQTHVGMSENGVYSQV